MGTVRQGRERAHKSHSSPLPHVQSVGLSPIQKPTETGCEWSKATQHVIKTGAQGWHQVLALEFTVPLRASLDWPAFGSKVNGCCLLLFEKYLPAPASGPLHMLNSSECISNLTSSMRLFQILPFLCRGLNHILAPACHHGPHFAGSALQMKPGASRVLQKGQKHDMKLKACRILAQSSSHLFYQGFFLNEKGKKK